MILTLATDPFELTLSFMVEIPTPHPSSDTGSSVNLFYLTLCCESPSLSCVQSTQIYSPSCLSEMFYKDRCGHIRIYKAPLYAQKLPYVYPGVSCALYVPLFQYLVLCCVVITGTRRTVCLCVVITGTGRTVCLCVVITEA